MKRKRQSKLIRWHLKRHTAFTVSLFSLSLRLSSIHCWYLDIVSDKRIVVIFACHSGIYHFIRQFFQKPAGYMCVGLIFFGRLQKKRTVHFLFLDFIISLILIIDQVFIHTYTHKCSSFLNLECQNNTCSRFLFSSQDKMCLWRRHVLKTSMSWSLLINKRKMSSFFGVLFYYCRHRYEI